jgi:NSS family neurotransmitter:Na+ symporter
MFGIVLYYSVIISWCLNYFIYSLNLSWGADPNNFFFNSFLAKTSGPGEVGNIRSSIILGLMLIWFLNWLIVYKGVQKGIEVANKFFMPLLFILTAVLVFWSISLEGARSGIISYLKPDFGKLAQRKVWIDAYSQIFFTLSLGFGIMIAYASYLPKKSDITANAFITSVANCLYSFFAGFAVFATLGYMSATTGKPIDEVVTKGIGLAFVAYPKAIAMLPAGEMFGAIFFLCLVVAGLSSSISIIEAFTAAIMDKFRIERKKVVTFLSVVGFAGGIIFTTGGGLFWLDIVDHFLSGYGLVVVGILECILVGWIFRAEKVREFVNQVSNFRVGTWWNFLIRYFIPIILGIIIFGNLVKELSQPYEGYSWSSLILIGRDWLLITLIAAFFLARRPWKGEVKDKEE